MKNLTRILKIIANSGYFNVATVKNTITHINPLPLGIGLLNKIKKEWHSWDTGVNTYLGNDYLTTNEDAIDTDHQFYNFTTNEAFIQTLLYIKNNFQKETPLAVKTETQFKYSKQAATFDGFQVSLPHGNFLRCSYFFNESSAFEYFYRIQRERKIWWMKYSCNPGRYKLCDLRSETVNNQKVQSVSIKSNFNFGDIHIENIYFVPLRASTTEIINELSMKDRRTGKRGLPVVIRTEFCLESAALALLMDAIENSKRGKIAIHRKVAPYQCSVFCHSEDSKILTELTDLAKHLCNVTRNSGISTLNLEKCYSQNEEMLTKELLEMDKVGVPYSLILEKETLNTGLIKLRNRDTTVSEIIHISDVPDYLLKILNS